MKDRVKALASCIHSTLHSIFQTFFCHFIVRLSISSCHLIGHDKQEREAGHWELDIFQDGVSQIFHCFVNGYRRKKIERNNKNFSFDFAWSCFTESLKVRGMCPTKDMKQLSKRQ